MTPNDDATAVAEQAAQWIVQLSADDAAEREQARRGFADWIAADPRHAAAAARLQGLLERLQAKPGVTGDQTRRPARSALDAAFQVETRQRRRKLLRGVVTAALMLVLCVPAWFVLKAYPMAYLTADFRTATGAWETRELEDGTRITLNSASAVNLQYDASRRVLKLVQGEILVEVARDPARPFVVETAHGSIRALGTRFVVSRQEDATVLSMLESRVTVRSVGDADGNETVVSAGQRVRIIAQAVGPVQDIDARSVADAWKFHQLVVRGQPLPQVLEALNRYRPGLISYDRAAIEHINVVAVLPLDDTDRALQLLGQSFPQLRMRRLSSYLVRVDAPAAP